jgi:hypothetical protein
MADTTRTSELDARVSELEARLREMERREHKVDPMRRIVSELFPSEARDHMRAARKEQLLAVRSFLDHWIEKIEERGQAPERENISID